MSGSALVVLGALCAGLACALALGGRSRATTEARLRSVSDNAPALQPHGFGRLYASAHRSVGRDDGAARRFAAIGAGVAVALMIGGPLGVAAGVGGGALVARWLAGHEPSAQRATRIRLAHDLPLAADLMATLLHAGATPERATGATAAVIGGPLGDRLAEVAAHLRLGADPPSAWRVLADVPPLAPLARALARASTTGAALTATLARLAEDERTATAWRAELAARRVGVRTAGPLGLCFLPAFILIGVVPVIVGIVQSLDISLG